MEFQNLIASDATEIVDDNEGARFSFLKGCYVEDLQPQGIIPVFAPSFLLSTSSFRLC